MRRLPRLLLVLLGLLAARAGPAAGRAEAPDTLAPPAPRENASFVSDDADGLRRAMEQAREAADAGDWATAVRLWQEVAERRRDPSDPQSALPWVWPVRGTTVYEGAFVVAHHAIVASGRKALDAYDRLVGSRARAALAEAVARRDREALAEVADRYLPHPAGRRAALLLADIALEADQADRARGWLDRLATLEEVAPRRDEEHAASRTSRIAREALAIARPERVDAVREALERRAAPDAPDAVRLAPVAPADRREEVPEEGWTTTGGRADRAAVAPALGSALELAWWSSLRQDAGLGAGRSTGERPSPWIPPRAVVDGDLAYLHDGLTVSVWRIAGESGGLGAGQVVAEKEVADPPWGFFENDPRARWGLLEGHTLTLGPRLPEGRLLFATVCDPRAWHGTTSRDAPRDDHLRALLFDGRRLHNLWRAGGAVRDEGMPQGLRLYGAALLYRDRLWIAGVRPTQATATRLEAWLLGLDPRTGAVEVRTFLGSGNPLRPGRPDEAIPSSPAGAAGRVVVSTSLGIASAVDARTGRVHWAFRYDRDVDERSRRRRLSDEQDRSDRASSFTNQPPLLALDHVWLAPTDGAVLHLLFDRPRGPERSLVRFAESRRQIVGSMEVEQIVGLHPRSEDGLPMLVVVGQGVAREGEPPPPMAVATKALTLYPVDDWLAVSPTGWGAEPAGRALLTTRELFVPTGHGIAIYDADDGRYLALLSRSDLPPERRARMDADVRPYGNLVPVPGRGILAVGPSVLAYWAVSR